MSEQGRLPKPLTLSGNSADNWKRFRQEFEIYLLSSEKEDKRDEVKIALLLNCGGEELIDVYNTLPIEKDCHVPYSDVMGKLQEYFEPKKNVTYERYIFFSRVQQSKETFDSFVADLRKKATTCEFGEIKEEMIRDKIICGIVEDNLRKNLLSKGNVTLDEVVRDCRAYEASEKQVKELGAAVSSINVQSRKPKKRNPPIPRELKTCKFCGQKHVFKRNLCPASNAVCNGCGKIGHFENMCYDDGWESETDDNTEDDSCKQS